jgi:hypothetical protein
MIEYNPGGGNMEFLDTFINSLTDIWPCRIPSTRARALLEKSPIYLGKPCKRGHHEGRFIASGECLICHRLKSQKSYYLNRIADLQREAPFDSSYPIT